MIYKIADLGLNFVRPIRGAFQVASMAAMQRQESFATVSFWVSQLCDFGWLCFCQHLSTLHAT